jgi:hypothetical protein
MGIPEKPTDGDTDLRPGRSLWLAVAAIVLAILAAVVIFATRAHFRETLIEFDIKFPRITLAALNPLFPIVLTGIAAATIIKELIPQLRPFANFWNGCVVFLALGSLAVYFAGVFWPLITLTQALS